MTAGAVVISDADTAVLQAIRNNPAAALLRSARDEVWDRKGKKKRQQDDDVLYLRAAFHCAWRAFGGRSLAHNILVAFMAGEFDL